MIKVPCPSSFRNPFEYDLPCEVCCGDPNDCLCLECPKCGQCGCLDCYSNHGLQMSHEQIQSKIEYQKWTEKESYAQ